MITTSTSAFFERANLQLGGLRRRAETLQSQIGSGERLLRSSDDPVAAARLRQISRQERLRDVDQSNAHRAATDLRLADSALGSIAGLAIRARDLALQANSPALSDANRSAIGTEIASLRENLLALANTRDAAGQALFGGEAPGAAFTQTAGVITYQGTTNAPVVELGDGQSVPGSITGPEFLNFDPGTGPTDLFEVLGALAAALAAGGAGATGAATAAIGALDAGLERITTAQTVIGTRQAWVETIDDRRVQTGELLAQDKASVGGTDLASTITRLQQSLTVLEASQASFVRLSGLSLFNLLR